LNDWVKEIKDCIEMKVLYFNSENELQVEKELEKYFLSNISH